MFIKKNKCLILIKQKLVLSGPGDGRPLPAAARRWCRARGCSPQTRRRAAAEDKANALRQSATGVLQRHHQPASPPSAHTSCRSPENTDDDNQRAFVWAAPTDNSAVANQATCWRLSECEWARERDSKKEDAVVLGGAAPATGVLVARRASDRRLRHLPPARHPHRRGRKPQAWR